MSETAEFLRFAAQSAQNRRGLSPEQTLGSADAPEDRGDVLIWPTNRMRMTHPVWIAARMAGDLRNLCPDPEAGHVDEHDLAGLGWSRADIARCAAEAAGYVRDWAKACSRFPAEPAAPAACLGRLAAARAHALGLACALSFCAMGCAAALATLI